MQQLSSSTGLATALQAGSGIDAFRAMSGGVALTSGDPEYDSARSVWNDAIDRRPAVIPRCTNAAEVAR